MRDRFEETDIFLDFNKVFDIYYTNLGGYHFQNDRTCCFYLNGALEMFQEQQKKIDELEELHKEAVRCLMESNYGDEKYLRRRGAIK